MIEIENQLFKMYSSLEKLESLDKYYYKKDNYRIKDNRYFLRSNIIESRKLDLFNLTSKSIYRYNQRELNTLPLYDYLFDRVGMLDLITSYRFMDSYRKKTDRLKKRINRIFELDNLFFLTFTFDDKKVIKNGKWLKQQTLRRYVVRWLKANCVDYVGNVDFGGENGRIHFHCVCSSIEPLINGKSWKYGALNFKHIYTKNDKRLSLYVNKLCSHALKESTKAQYLIYPKKKYD